MAQKVIDVTRYKDHYDELSKTPKNYVKDNYFIKELQDKVNSEWEYRPNRVDIEYEAIKGTMERAVQKHFGDDQSIWKPIEVVMQSVKSEKGTIISDDYRKIVFKDILESRFNIGSKFRFTPDYVNVGDAVRGQDINIKPELDGLDFDYEVIADDQTDFQHDNYDKVYTSESNVTRNVWLGINTNRVKMTSSMVIQRCNGVLGSTYLDAQKIEHYHYEPVIQATDLSNTNLFYNDIAILPKGSILIIAQHNDFTSSYFINQRFIVGYNQVFRITAINNFYSNYTFDPKQVGLIKITLEHDEISEYDNFDKLIAYQNDHDKTVAPVDGESSTNEYYYVFEKPEIFPSNLTSENIIFQPVIKDAGGQIIGSPTMYVDLELTNLPSTANFADYVNISDLTLVEGNKYKITGTNNIFKLSRKRMYIKGKLNVKCYVLPADSPTNDRLELSFSLLTNSVE